MMSLPMILTRGSVCVCVCVCVSINNQVVDSSLTGFYKSSEVGGGGHITKDPLSLPLLQLLHYACASHTCGPGDWRL